MRLTRYGSHVWPAGKPERVAKVQCLAQVSIQALGIKLKSKPLFD